MRRRPPRHEPGELHPPAEIIVTDDRHPLTGESSTDTWKRWSQERAERDRLEQLRQTALNQADTERGIYPVEIARYVAQHHAQGACPEWRYLKDLCAQEFGRILREQPEMRQRDVQSRERIITALFGALPAHMQGALSELRTVMELVATARESAAFLMAFEIGREAGRRDALRDPRVMLAPSPQRRALPPHPEEPGTLRLHIHDEDAFDEKGWRIK